MGTPKDAGQPPPDKQGHKAVLTTEDEDKMTQDGVEGALISELNSSGAPLTPSELVEHLAKKGLSGDLVRTALWTLLAMKKLGLDLERHVVVEPKSS